jgi:8-oxo-dGTP pyrophosphatase MutT (NUDIX family)
MEQLGKLIISKTLSGQTIEKYRLAARGIIIDNGKLLMIHSKFYNDYTFPGGGVENGEEELLALNRECEEEAGVVIKNVRPFYKTVEKREINDKEYLIHESHFYLCEIKEYCEMHLENYEIDLGYEPVWISIDEAIQFDIEKINLLSEDDYKGVLERELLILYKLKEII